MTTEREMTAAEKKHEDLKDQYGLFQRAKMAFDTYGDITIARFESVSRSPDTSGRQRNKLAIQRNAKAIFYTSNSREPQLLGPGVYSVGKLLPEIQGRDGNSRDLSAEVGLCCIIEDLAVTATFVFPDMYGFEESADADKALTTLAIRTSDDLLGAVRLQMSMRCDRPERLIKAFAMKHVQDDKGKKIDVVKIERSGEKVGILQRMYNRVFGTKGEVEFIAHVCPLTLADLYERINLELATVVRAAVRNCTARDLYDTVDVRSRVEVEIKKGMEDTLRAFGILTERVSAFQFFCPDYEKMLQQRGGLAIKEQGLEDHRKRAAINDEYRTVEQDQRQKNVTYGAEITRHKAAEGAKTTELTDQHLAEQERRGRQRAGEQNDFDRQQTRLDHQAEITRQREEKLLEYDLAERELRLRMQWAEHQQKVLGQQQTLEHQQKLAAMEAISKMPPELALQYMMLYNPQLQQAFTAMQEAQGKDAQLQMALAFQQQLAAIHGQNSQQMHQLLVEAARLVAAKRAGQAQPAQQLPHVINISNTATPNDPPPPDGGAAQ